MHTNTVRAYAGACAYEYGIARAPPYVSNVDHVRVRVRVRIHVRMNMHVHVHVHVHRDMLMQACRRIQYPS